MFVNYTSDLERTVSVLRDFCKKLYFRKYNEEKMRKIFLVLISLLFISCKSDIYVYPKAQKFRVPKDSISGITFTEEQIEFLVKESLCHGNAVDQSFGCTRVTLVQGEDVIVYNLYGKDCKKFRELWKDLKLQEMMESE